MPPYLFHLIKKKKLFIVRYGYFPFIDKDFEVEILRNMPNEILRNGLKMTVLRFEPGFWLHYTVLTPKVLQLYYFYSR